MLLGVITSRADHYDVVVVGGGTSGVCAAVQSARLSGGSRHRVGEHDTVRAVGGQLHLPPVG